MVAKQHITIFIVKLGGQYQPEMVDYRVLCVVCCQQWDMIATVYQARPSLALQKNERRWVRDGWLDKLGRGRKEGGRRERGRREGEGEERGRGGEREGGGERGRREGEGGERGFLQGPSYEQGGGVLIGCQV